MGHSGPEQPHSGKSLEWQCISLNNAIEIHTHLLNSALFQRVCCEVRIDSKPVRVDHDFPTIISDEGAMHTTK